MLQWCRREPCLRPCKAETWHVEYTCSEILKCTQTSCKGRCRHLRPSLAASYLGCNVHGSGKCRPRHPIPASPNTCQWPTYCTPLQAEVDRKDIPQQSYMHAQTPCKAACATQQSVKCNKQHEQNNTDTATILPLPTFLPPQSRFTKPRQPQSHLAS